MKVNSETIVSANGFATSPRKRRTGLIQNVNTLMLSSDKFVSSNELINTMLKIDNLNSFNKNIPRFIKTLLLLDFFLL